MYSEIGQTIARKMQNVGFEISPDFFLDKVQYYAR